MAKPGAKKQTKGGVKKRAIKRLRGLTNPPKGVSRKGGISYGEARKIRGAHLEQKRTAGGGPTRDTAGNPIDRVVDAESDLEYGAADRLLGRDIDRQQAHETTIGKAFDAYNARATQLQSAAAAATTASLAMQNASNAASQQQVTAIDTAVQGGATKEAALLGQTDGQVANHAKETAKGVQSYVAGGNAVRNKSISDHGLAEVADIGMRGTITARERIEALARNQSAVGDLLEDRRALQGEKRKFRTSRRAELRRGAQDQYIATLGLQQDALSEKEDRALKERLGIMDFQSDAADRAADIKMNNDDNRADTRQERIKAQARARSQNEGSGTSGGNATGDYLSPSEKKEWTKLKNKYVSAAQRYRKNAKKLSGPGARHQTAKDIGWDGLSRQDMNAIIWIAKGGKLPKGVKTYLQGQFPGGASPWG